MKSWYPILMLALFIAVAFAAAGLGAFFTSTSLSNWYPTLRKPSWNPPAWIFGRIVAGIEETDRPRHNPIQKMQTKGIRFKR
jgi:hypothetical protein